MPENLRCNVKGIYVASRASNKLCSLYQVCTKKKEIKAFMQPHLKGLKRPLTPRANAPSVRIEQVRNRNQRNRNESKNTRRPRHTEVVEHCSREERESARKHGAQEGIRRNGTGRVALEGIDEVV